MSSVRRHVGPPRIALGILLYIFSAPASDVSAFDFSRYRPRMMKELSSGYKAQPGLVITQDVPIRSQVTYSGEFRDLPGDSRRLIVSWAEAMNIPRARRDFLREVKVREAGVDYWVPVQEVLVPTMRAELRPGEEIELFMIYIGQADGRHLFLVNAFDHERPH